MRQPRFTNFRRPVCVLFVGVIAAGPLALSGCDQTESEHKSTTTTTTRTPEGTKKTTETTEKKVETNPK